MEYKRDGSIIIGIRMIDMRNYLELASQFVIYSLMLCCHW